jgi:gas vesicle protein
MITRDDVLSRMGLQRRTEAVDYILPSLGLFGVGIMVGAGLGLMFAPKRGAELRTDITRAAENMADKLRRKKDEALEELNEVDVFGNLGSDRGLETHQSGSHN